MQDAREIEKKIKQGIDVDLGKHEVPIDLSPGMRSEVQSIGIELQKEDQLPNSLNYNQIMAIIIGRARSWKKNQEDPNIRGQIVNDRP